MFDVTNIRKKSNIKNCLPHKAVNCVHSTLIIAMCREVQWLRLKGCSPFGWMKYLSRSLDKAE